QPYHLLLRHFPSPLPGQQPQPTHLADFNQVQTIQYSNSEDKDRKGMLQLKIAGAPEPLTVTAPSLTIAENMADLIDGYCRLVNGATQSFIIRPQKEGERALPSIPKLANSEKQGVRMHAVSMSGKRPNVESPTVQAARQKRLWYCGRRAMYDIRCLLSESVTANIKLRELGAFSLWSSVPMKLLRMKLVGTVILIFTFVLQVWDIY
ncbi:hypothetical protein MC885_013876, partial [Smutsia gigantea]